MNGAKSASIEKLKSDNPPKVIDTFLSLKFPEILVIKVDIEITVDSSEFDFLIFDFDF